MISIYLEMREHPRLQTRAPHRGGMLLRLEEPSVAFYRYLDERVGVGPDRLRGLSDSALAEAILEPQLDVFVLYMGGAPAGFFELDRRREGEVRLTRFGLLPEFRGRHLGKWLLGLAVDACWDHRPDRVWTCVTDRDDARALLLCQWAGFTPYETVRDDEGGGRAPG